MKYPMRSYTGADSVRLALPMIGLLLFGLLADARAGNYAPFPRPDAGYVTDLVGLLTEEQEQQLESWLLQTEEDRGVEIIVVAIRSMQDYPGTPNQSIETFARALFDAYGIGNMPRNNGVLLLVATQDRKARIELGAGYGHSRDRDADRVMQRAIVPHFRREQYAAGVTNGVKALMREFGGMMFLPHWLPWAVAGLIAVLVPVAISLFRNGKRGWGWVVAGAIIVLVLVLIWLTRRVAEEIPDSVREAGGLGGFGGGFSGGGGATGSW